MMKILLLLLSLLTFSCSAVKMPILIPRPWYHIYKSSKKINIPSSFSIDISGQVRPLIGDERLLQEQLKNNLIFLLERRGFEKAENDGDYSIKLLYDVNKEKKEINSSYTSSGFASGQTGITINNPGVFAAQTVWATASAASVETYSVNKEIEYFVYSISLELFQSNEIIWQGKSIWDSKVLVTEEELLPVLQLLLSDLPKDNSTIPRVKRINPEKADLYYKLNLSNKSFTCPALPYRITFPPKIASNEGPSITTNHEVLEVLELVKALGAFQDLVLTAEEALPSGNGVQEAPLDEKNWVNIALIGKYYLGESDDVVNILIRLESDELKYNVKECRLISSESYNSFLEKQQEWKKIVSNYLNFFK